MTEFKFKEGIAMLALIGALGLATAADLTKFANNTSAAFYSIADVDKCLAELLYKGLIERAGAKGTHEHHDFLLTDAGREKIREFLADEVTYR